MRYLPCFGVALLFVAPRSALAQGFPGDVVPYPSGGKIVTGGYDHYVSPPQPSQAERVFLYDFAQDRSDPNFITDPGFDNPAGFTPLPAGQPLGFHITTDLLYWSGAGAVSFSPAPDPYKLMLSLGSQHMDITGSSATGNFPTIQVSDSNGRLHTHVGSTIDLDAPEGIYLIGMTLNMPGLVDSKPIYVLYNDLRTLLLSPSDADFDQAEATGETAAAWVQTHIDSIPEPSSWVLGVIGAGCLAATATLCRARRRWATTGS